MTDYGNLTNETTQILNDSFAALGGLVVCGLVIALACVVFYVWLFYRIFQKSGYNGWMSLLLLIPFFGELICLCILAFDRWPIGHGAPGTADGFGGGTPGAMGGIDASTDRGEVSTSTPAFVGAAPPEACPVVGTAAVESAGYPASPVADSAVAAPAPIPAPAPVSVVTPEPTPAPTFEPAPALTSEPAPAPAAPAEPVGYPVPEADAPADDPS